MKRDLIIGLTNQPATRNPQRAESIPAFEKAIEQLGNDTSEDYWKSTEGNAKKALCGLLAFAKLRPDGVWSGD